MRYKEPGWKRIGRFDDVRRRSLWMRITYYEGNEDRIKSIELCAGREGDDDYVRIERTNIQWKEIEEVLLTAYWCAELAEDKGIDV